MSIVYHKVMYSKNHCLLFILHISIATGSATGNVEQNVFFLRATYLVKYDIDLRI